MFCWAGLPCFRDPLRGQKRRSMGRARSNAIAGEREPRLPRLLPAPSRWPIEPHRTQPHCCMHHVQLITCLSMAGGGTRPRSNPPRFSFPPTLHSSTDSNSTRFCCCPRLSSTSRRGKGDKPDTMRPTTPREGPQQLCASWIVLDREGEEVAVQQVRRKRRKKAGS